MNDTISKFNYPESLIKEYNCWVVLIRDKQVTLGSLILAYKGDCDSLSNVSREGYVELEIVIKEVEVTLKRVFHYDKINYLALMMIDKEVHMHIIPRYDSSRKFRSKLYFDSGWPGQPDFNYDNDLSKSELNLLREYLSDSMNSQFEKALIF